MHAHFNLMCMHVGLSVHIYFRTMLVYLCDKDDDCKDGSNAKDYNLLYVLVMERI